MTNRHEPGPQRDSVTVQSSHRPSCSRHRNSLSNQGYSNPMRLRSPLLGAPLLGAVVVGCFCNLIFSLPSLLGGTALLGDHASSAHEPKPLPPVHVNSSWIGNQWMPPQGYRLYNTREIQNFFRNHSVLIVGDSTARRTYGTFYGILNATTHPDDVSIQELNDPNVIDVNKRRIQETCDKEGFLLCRNMPHDATRQFDLLDDGVCLENLVESARDPNSVLMRNAKLYSLVIFILGPWEVTNRVECGAGKRGRTNQTDDFFSALFTTTANNTNFVWRTWGSPGTTNSDPRNGIRGWNKARAHNDYVKGLVNANEATRKRTGQSMSTVSYIDWGQAMLPRLLPQEQRIAGDIDPHYGLEARLAFVQMLMNHLVERERQKRLNMPWIKDYSSDDNSRTNSHAEADDFMTITMPGEVFTFEERLAFDRAQLAFCGECAFAKGISCQMRKDYFQFKHNLPESKALHAVMSQTSACNKSAMDIT